MSVRVFDSPFIHRFDRDDDDDRLGWTRCGIRFMWDRWHDRRGQLPRCGGCWG